MTICNKIDAVRAFQPSQYINDTNYALLAGLPIIVSIETKRGSENWNQAMLQMGVWQGVQLRSLQSLYKGGGAHDEKRDESPVFFLLELIIQGHDWSFVLSVRDGSRAVSFLFV